MKIPSILINKAKELEEYYNVHYKPLAPLAARCFLNTMETTVKQLEDGSYFVITGDIPAMWLRDSAAQVRPYVKYAAQDRELRDIIEGVIAKQAEFVCLDPYANAFNERADGSGHKDETENNDHVWERKYEVDSLCAPLYLGHAYWKATGVTGIFTPVYKEMIVRILETFITEQDHSRSKYFFTRHDCVKTDTLPAGGKGRPVNVTGMTWSGFRPSDDCCKFGYLIPANMMAVTALGYAEEISRDVYGDVELAGRCKALAEEIRDGIMDYGVVNHHKYGRIYAYETDGFGNYNLMDDANSPSLLGMGSPHTPEGYVWHIGIIMQALTSTDKKEIGNCLEMLADTHAGTNYMHESFNPEEPEEFTRPWFAWANSLFGELLGTLMEQGFFDGEEK